MRFSEKITRLMNFRGYNQSTMADALGVSQPTVGRWLRESTPHPNTAQRLADFFEVPLDLLLDDSKEIPRESWSPVAAIKKAVTEKYPGDLELQDASAHAHWMELGARKAVLDHANHLRVLAEKLKSEAEQLEQSVPKGDLVSAKYPTSKTRAAKDAALLIKEAKARAHQNEFRNPVDDGKTGKGTGQPKAAS